MLPQKLQMHQIGYFLVGSVLFSMLFTLSWFIPATVQYYAMILLAISYIMWAQIVFLFVDNYNIIEIGIKKVCISGNNGDDGLDLARYTY